MSRDLSLMVRLSGLLFWFDESLQSSLEKAGFEPVSRSQSMFLLCLASGRNKPSQIAEQLGVSRQAVSHIISNLSDRGLITLRPDPEDARGRIVDYSNKAEGLRQAAHAIVAALEDLLKERIGASAFRDLRAGLAKDWGAVALIDMPRAPATRRGKS